MVGNNGGLGRIPRLLNTRETLCVTCQIIGSMAYTYYKTHKGTHSILISFFLEQSNVFMRYLANPNNLFIDHGLIKDITYKLLFSFSYKNKGAKRKIFSIIG